MRRFTGLLVALILLAAAASAPAAAVREQPGQEEPDQIRVLIENVLPHAPQRKGSVTIVGRLANSTEQTLPVPGVQMRFSPTRLISREEVGQVLAGTSARSGTVLPSTVTPLGDELPPGQQVGFRLTTPVADLGLPASAGVYAMFIEATSGGVSQATSGTVFPWFPEAAEYSPSQLSLLWPITQVPGVAAKRLLVTDDVAAEFIPGGRVDRLITAGDTHAVTWLVDAATLQTAREMSEGYEVLIDGRTETGDETAAAASVADRLSTVLQRKPWAQMPQFALSDDDALTRGGQEQMVVRSATLPLVVRDAEAGGSTAGLVYTATTGEPSRQTLATLVDAGVRVAIMSDAAFPPEETLTYTPSGITSLDAAGTNIDVVLTDSRLDSYLSGPFDTAAQRSAALQGVLSDTALITLELPAQPRNVAAMPPLLWDPPEKWTDQMLKQLSEAPWIRLIGLQTMLEGDGEVPRLSSGPGGQRKQLPARYIERLAQLQDDLESLTAIVDEPNGFAETFSLAIQRAASNLWRRKPNERRLLVATIDQQLQQERNSVSVLSSGTITLAGDSGIVPLTVANDLDDAVTVGIELRPREGIGLEYQEPDLVSIDAAAKAGLEIPVRVVGSQPVAVDVIITDRDGNEFSNSAAIVLRSTAATRIASYIIGLGGFTLALLIVLQLWRRRRSTRSREEGADEPG